MIGPNIAYSYIMHFTVTGKSLLQALWMNVFHGEAKPTLTSITEAVAYEKLAGGEHIYGEYGYWVGQGHLSSSVSAPPMRARK